jgi:hypothetical protein
MHRHASLARTVVAPVQNQQLHDAELPAQKGAKGQSQATSADSSPGAHMALFQHSSRCIQVAEPSQHAQPLPQLFLENQSFCSFHICSDLLLYLADMFKVHVVEQFCCPFLIAAEATNLSKEDGCKFLARYC